MSKKFQYRLFPIYFLSFLRVASTFSISLALPLYYYGKLEDGLIGFLTGATALSYLFSPYLFRNAYKRLGIKKSLVIATGMMFGVQIGLQFSLEWWIPTYLLLFLDGISLGLFWPIITSAYTMLLSYDGIREDEREKGRLSSNLGLSWNSGGIFGYLLSAFALFIISDILLVFDLSFIYMLISFIISFLFEEPKSFDLNGVIIDDNDIQINSSENFIFPYFLPLILVALFAFVNGCFGIIFPIKFDILGYKESLTYFLSFIKMIFQTIIVTLAMTYAIRRLKNTIPICLVLLILSILIFGIIDNLIIYGLIFAILGIIFGLFYCFSFKMSILKNMQKNNMRGTTIFETTMGISFWLGPFIGGLIISINPLFASLTLTIIILLSALFYLSLQNKIIKAE